jgi:hypothetical protein
VDSTLMSAALARLDSSSALVVAMRKLDVMMSSGQATCLMRKRDCTLASPAPGHAS